MAIEPIKTREGMKVNCPFCENDEYGCCFCDHTGKVLVGESEIIKSSNEADKYRGHAKESDLKELYDKGGFNNLRGKPIN